MQINFIGKNEVICEYKCSTWWQWSVKNCVTSLYFIHACHRNPFGRLFYMTWATSAKTKHFGNLLCIVNFLFKILYLYFFLLKTFPVKTLSCDKFEHFFFLRHIASPSGISYIFIHRDNRAIVTKNQNIVT